MDSYMILSFMSGLLLATVIFSCLFHRTYWGIPPTPAGGRQAQMSNHGTDHAESRTDSNAIIDGQLDTSGDKHDTEMPSSRKNCEGADSKLYKRLFQREKPDGQWETTERSIGIDRDKRLAFLVYDRIKSRFDYPREDVSIEIKSEYLKKALRGCLQNVNSVLDLNRDVIVFFLHCW